MVRVASSQTLICLPDYMVLHKSTCKETECSKATLPVDTITCLLLLRRVVALPGQPARLRTSWLQCTAMSLRPPSSSLSTTSTKTVFSTTWAPSASAVTGRTRTSSAKSRPLGAQLARAATSIPSSDAPSKTAARRMRLTRSSASTLEWRGVSSPLATRCVTATQTRTSFETGTSRAAILAQTGSS